MPFDPNKPFERVEEAPTKGKSKFDPNKPFEVVSDDSETKSSTQGTFDEQISGISNKYGVSPSLLRKYALAEGSTEAAESGLGKAGAVAAGALQSGIAMGIPGKLYRMAQKEDTEKALDEVQRLVEDRKSVLQKGAEFGVGMLVPGGAAVKGASAAAKIGKGAATGAAYGAGAGFGASEAGGEVSGATTGAVLGAPLGAVAPAVGAAIQKAGRLAKEGGEEALTKMFGVGRTPKQREELLEAGKTPLEATMETIKKIGGIKETDKEFADILTRMKAGKKEMGEWVGENIKMADTQKDHLNNLLKAASGDKQLGKEFGVLPKAGFFKNVNEELADEIKAIAGKFGDIRDDRNLAKGLLKEAQRYTKKASKSEMSLQDLQRMKVALDSRINYQTKNKLDSSHNFNMRTAVNNVIEKQIKQVSDATNFINANQAQFGKITPDKPHDMLNMFKETKKAYADYSKIVKAAAKAEAERLKGQTTTSKGLLDPGTSLGIFAGLVTADPITGIATKFIGGGIDKMWKEVQAGKISPITAKRMIDEGAKAIQKGEKAELVLQRFMRESTKEGID